MTVCSTIVAMLMMPFNIWVYGHSLENNSGVSIPYLKMVRSLMYVTAPAALGMLVFYKFPKFAPYITKVSPWLSSFLFREFRFGVSIFKSKREGVPE